MFSVASPDVAPPVKPDPATTLVISAVALFVTVIVLPLCVTSIPEPPCIVTVSPLETVSGEPVSVSTLQLL